MPRKNLDSKAALLKAVTDGEAYEEDAAQAIEFIDYYTTVEKLSKGSKAKYFYCLKAFLMQLRILEKKAASLDEQGVLDLMKFVHESTWSEDTRADYWDRFTRFWSWAADRAADKGTEWDKRAYRLLADPKHKKPYKIDKNKQTKKGILTPEELLRLVDAEPNIAYKAFFSVLYESGMRAGEACSLLLRDVEAHDNGQYTLHIRTSKTDKRPVPIMSNSVNYLRKWLSHHPKKQDLDAPLWLNTRGGALNGFTANKELKLLMRVTKINRKKVSLHSFRHSRATELAGKGLTEFEMCRLFGWRVGSKMPATYIREGALDVRTALRRASGLPVDEEEHKPIGQRCLQCDHINALETEYCDNCNLPLSAEKLSAIKDNARAVHERELAKKYAREIFKEEIASVMKEFKLILKEKKHL